MWNIFQSSKINIQSRILEGIAAFRGWWRGIVTRRPCCSRARVPSRARTAAGAGSRAAWPCHHHYHHHHHHHYHHPHDAQVRADGCPHLHVPGWDLHLLPQHGEAGRGHRHRQAQDSRAHSHNQHLNIRASNEACRRLREVLQSRRHEIGTSAQLS